MSWVQGVSEGTSEMADIAAQPLPLYRMSGNGATGGGGSWGAEGQGRAGFKMQSVIMTCSAAFLCMTIVLEEWLTRDMPLSLMKGRGHLREAWSEQ